MTQYNMIIDQNKLYSTCVYQNISYWNNINHIKVLQLQIIFRCCNLEHSTLIFLRKIPDQYNHIVYNTHDKIIDITLQFDEKVA